MTYAEGKRFTEAEMAAEMWVAVGKRCEAFWMYGEHRAWRDDPKTEKLWEIEVIMGRFAMAEHAAVNGYA
jgi:hypothetical protein